MSPGTRSCVRARAIIEIDVGELVNSIFKPPIAAYAPVFPRTRGARLLRWPLVLFTFLFLGMPLAAVAATTFEDSARDLAQKIAARMPVTATVSVEVRNLSNLEPGEIAQVEREVEAELQTRGIHTGPTETVGMKIVVTLSQNLKEFVWTAEIREKDSTKVVLLSVPRELQGRAASGDTPVRLRTEKFWEGRERLLDAAIVTNADGGDSLVLLFPGGVEIRKVGGSVSKEVNIPSDQTSKRDPNGILDPRGSVIVVRLDPKICMLDRDTGTINECHSTDGPPGGRDPIEGRPPFNPVFFGLGDEMSVIGKTCNIDGLFLAAGKGDYAERDSIRIFEKTETRLIPVSGDVTVPGPVMALSPLSFVPTAIIRNLDTGNYEAYHLYISCDK